MSFSTTKHKVNTTHASINIYTYVCMYVCIHFKNIPFITNLGNSTKRKEYFLKVKKNWKVGH